MNVETLKDPAVLLKARETAASVRSVEPIGNLLARGQVVHAREMIRWRADIHTKVPREDVVAQLIRHLGGELKEQRSRTSVFLRAP